MPGDRPQVCPPPRPQPILTGRMFGRRRPTYDSTYVRSQAFTGLPVRPSAVARGLCLRLLAAGDDPCERCRIAQMLVDELSAQARLTPCQVAVAPNPPAHDHPPQPLPNTTY